MQVEANAKLRTPPRTLEELRERLATLFEEVALAGDHESCVKYGTLLSKVLPSTSTKNGREPMHPDASSIAAIRAALQGTGDQ